MEQNAELKKHLEELKTALTKKPSRKLHLLRQSVLHPPRKLNPEIKQVTGEIKLWDKFKGYAGKVRKKLAVA